jgi:hypothetical protein
VLKTNSTTRLEQEIKDSEHFCYVCVKKNGADKKYRLNWPAVYKQILSEQSQDGEEESEDDSELDRELEQEAADVIQL